MFLEIINENIFVKLSLNNGYTNLDFTYEFDMCVMSSGVYNWYWNHNKTKDINKVNKMLQIIHYGILAPDNISTT